MKQHLLLVVMVALSSGPVYGDPVTQSTHLSQLIRTAFEKKKSKGKNVVPSSDDTPTLVRRPDGAICCFFDPDKHEPCETLSKGLAPFLLHKYKRLKNNETPRSSCEFSRSEFPARSRMKAGSVVRVITPPLEKQ